MTKSQEKHTCCETKAANLPARKYKVNPLNMPTLVLLQLLRAQSGKELGFSWRVENRGNRKPTYDFPSRAIGIGLSKGDKAR